MTAHQIRSAANDDAPAPKAAGLAYCASVVMLATLWLAAIYGWLWAWSIVGMVIEP